jgi:lysophospholipid acyltransferase (LPLAT)-like uncharacterized protein
MGDVLYRASLALVPLLYVGLSRLWFRTCRVTVHDEQYLQDALKQGAIIVPFWHYSFLYMFYHLRHYSAMVLVSASRDGEYIARIAEHLHFQPVRGSSNRQGAQAVRKLLRTMKAGSHLGIVADGSQGPARRLQPGAVFLAAKTGAPILPIVWAANRYKTFHSWDRTVLPLPFCRVVIRYGEPLIVPSDLEAEGMEEYRQLLERKMNELYEQVWLEFGIKRHDNGPGGGR